MKSKPAGVFLNKDRKTLSENGKVCTVANGQFDILLQIVQAHETIILLIDSVIASVNITPSKQIAHHIHKPYAACCYSVLYFTHIIIYPDA